VLGCSDIVKEFLDRKTASRMVDIAEVADKIFRFETPVSSALYSPTVYIIREAEAVLIEPGPSSYYTRRSRSVGVFGCK
jgi:hypothetical protein